MRIFVENKVRDDGYGSVGEYFRELVRRGQRHGLESMKAMVERHEPAVRRSGGCAQRR